jgi:hypothetical protein
MAWVAGFGMVLGLLAIALGTASIRTGWTLPWVRRRVTRPWIHGLGAFLVGASCVVQGLFYFRIVPSPSWEVRFFATNALTFSGLILIGAAHVLATRRRS